MIISGHLHLLSSLLRVSSGVLPFHLEVAQKLDPLGQTSQLPEIMPGGLNLAGLFLQSLIWWPIHIWRRAPG